MAFSQEQFQRAADILYYSKKKTETWSGRPLLSCTVHRHHSALTESSIPFTFSAHTICVSRMKFEGQKLCLMMDSESVEEKPYRVSIGLQHKDDNYPVPVVIAEGPLPDEIRLDLSHPDATRVLQYILAR